MGYNGARTASGMGELEILWYSDEEEELLVPPEEMRNLQTTKWPVLINNAWHTAVVYSDVTKGVLEIEDRNSFMVHSMRNHLMTALLGRDLLDDLKIGSGGTPQDLLDARRFVRIGLGGLAFYLDHLLRFMRATMRIEDISCQTILASLRKQVDDLRDLNRNVLTVNVLFDTGIQGKTVRADLDFLESGFQELLHNAEKR